MTAQSLDMRASLFITRLLALTNGLEAIVAFAAVAWALSIVCLAGEDSASAPLASLFAPIMALTGTLSLMGLWRGWRRIRTAGSLIAFIGWGMQAALSWQVEVPGFAQTFGLYATLAAAELALYVRTKLELDCRDKQLGNLYHALHTTEGDDRAGRPYRPD